VVEDPVLDRHEVVDDPADAVEETDLAPDRLVEEEEEFFDFSQNDDIRDESLALEPPQVDPTDEEEVVRPKWQRKVWEQILEY
jgi:hypothetical protein